MSSHIKDVGHAFMFGKTGAGKSFLLNCLVTHAQKHRPYTFILEATREVPKLIQNKRKQVGIRVPASPTAQALVRELGRPIISSTAAPPGEDPMVDPHEIDARFKGLAMVLDGGAGGLVPTSVIDLTRLPPEIVREGAGSVEEFR